QSSKNRSRSSTAGSAAMSTRQVGTVLLEDVQDRLEDRRGRRHLRPGTHDREALAGLVVVDRRLGPEERSVALADEALVERGPRVLHRVRSHGPGAAAVDERADGELAVGRDLLLERLDLLLQ